jgi:hypothetical protein
MPRKLTPVACTLCGVLMNVAEKPGHRGGVVAPYHSQCADIEYHFSHPSTAIDPFFKAEIARDRAKLIAKRQGLVTDYP